jgi:hypothetical protein
MGSARQRRQDHGGDVGKPDNFRGRQLRRTFKANNAGPRDAVGAGKLQVPGVAPPATFAVPLHVTRPIATEAAIPGDAWT